MKKTLVLNFIFLILAVVVLGYTSGCSLARKIAMNQVGDALASSGTAFSSDNDPELIKDAVPFSLKLMESILAETPKHDKLLLAVSSGFTQYSYAFVQQEADELEDQDLAKATEIRTRAQHLYIRARDYGIRGLELKHQGFEKTLRENPKKAVQIVTVKDVPLLYWTALSWGAAISISKNNPDLIADQPVVETMIDRALELKEDYEHGAIHTFLITYESARQGGKGDFAERSLKHFDRAIALSNGQLVSPMVAYAETVCVAKQNKAEFQSLLNKALSVNVDAKPEWRLMNLVMQRRARWLLSRTEQLFVE